MHACMQLATKNPQDATLIIPPASGGEAGERKREWDLEAPFNLWGAGTAGSGEQPFTFDEDASLFRLVATYGKQWKAIANQPIFIANNRNAESLRMRWRMIEAKAACE